MANEPESGTAQPPAPPVPPVADDGAGPSYLDGLTGKQELAVLALLSEPNVTKAAEKAGVGARTLYRWMESDQRFIAAHRAARRQAFQHAMQMTQRYAPMAIQALAKVMTDSACPASARVSAAVAMLNFNRDSIELDDLAERVKALESAANPPPPTHAMPPPTPPASEEPQRQAA